MTRNDFVLQTVVQTIGHYCHLYRGNPDLARQRCIENANALADRLFTVEGRGEVVSPPRLGPVEEAVGALLTNGDEDVDMEQARSLPPIEEKKRKLY